MKKSKKHSVRFYGFVAICLIAVLLSSVCAAETVTGDLSARFATQTIEYEGETYKLRSRLTTILVAGTDKVTEETTAANKYRSGGQSDFIMLLVIDDNQRTITPIQISRDTMVDLTVIVITGQRAGQRYGQIALQHAYGDGKELSAELLMETVSRYLLDSPIDHYVTMKMAGIVPFNDLIGGVEVTIVDDFSELDPTMTIGTTLVLHGMQAEYFVRGRMAVGDGTNINRLRRQRAYINAAKDIVMGKLRQSPNYINTLFEELDEYLLTDMNRGRLLNIANKANQYDVLPILTIDGYTTVGKYDFIEFYPDEDSLTRAVLDAFYQKSH